VVRYSSVSEQSTECSSGVAPAHELALDIQHVKSLDLGIGQKQPVDGIHVQHTAHKTRTNHGVFTRRIVLPISASSQNEHRTLDYLKVHITLSIDR
jgi:hypothetical protein